MSLINRPEEGNGEILHAAQSSIESPNGAEQPAQQSTNHEPSDGELDLRRGMGGDPNEMSPREILHLLAHVLRRPDLFQEARRFDLWLQFRATYAFEHTCFALGEIMMTPSLSTGTMPARDMIERAIEQYFERYPQSPLSMRQALASLVRRAYSLDISDSQRGVELMRKFAHERFVAAEIRLHSWGDNLERDAAAIQTLAERLAIVKGIGCGDKFRLYGAQEFLSTDFRSEWLLEDFLVVGQPAVIAGPTKAMKTSVALEMAVCMSLGRGRLFNRFELGHCRRNVGFMSGESGGATIQDTLRRICAARGHGVPPGLQLCLQVPRVHDEIAHLTRLIRANAWTVVIIDPLYLMLLVKEADPDAAMKLHRMGALLDMLCRACLELECTPVLIHHTTKNLGGRRGDQIYDPLELTDVHGAGIAEFMRQWILINRREPFADGANVERVWLRTGGSAGHSSLWALDIAQGRFNSTTLRRESWIVSVYTREHAKELATQRREEHRQTHSEAVDREVAQQVLEALGEHPEGLVITRLREAAGLPRNRDIDDVLERLIEDGLITRNSELRSGGANTRPLVVYRLNQDPHHTNPEPADDGDAAVPADVGPQVH